MPQPSQAPTEAQILTVSEIMLEPYEKAETLISADSVQAVSDAKWTATLADITSWESVGSDSGDVKRVDTIEFFEGAAAASRLDFRNKVRQRYGLEPLASEKGAQIGTISTIRFF